MVHQKGLLKGSSSSSSPANVEESVRFVSIDLRDEDGDHHQQPNPVVKMGDNNVFGLFKIKKETWLRLDVPGCLGPEEYADDNNGTLVITASEANFGRKYKYAVIYHGRLKKCHGLVNGVIWVTFELQT